MVKIKMTKKKLIVALMILCGLFFCKPIFAEDGTYNAFITDTGGTYIGTALVEGEMVTAVSWSEGQEIFDPGLQITDSQANGLDSDGRPISVELEDYY